MYFKCYHITGIILELNIHHVDKILVSLSFRGLRKHINVKDSYDSDKSPEEKQKI
jgi:hypothetical protein